MSGSIRQQANLLISGAWSRESIGKIFAVKAREIRDEAIRSGQAAPTYRTFVDGVEGAKEEATRIGGGVVYQFNQMPAAVAFAFSYAIARSPIGKGRDKHPGRFRKSWIVAVGGKDYSGAIEAIPFGSTVLLVNIVPYARMLTLGRHKFTLASNLPSDLRQAVNKQFPTIDASAIFVDLPPSLSRAGAVVPYQTKRGPVRYPAVQMTPSAR